jgi:Na+/proline symporter
MLLVLDAEVSVFEFVLTYGWAVLGAAFAPQVILLLLWKRASYAGCLAGMLTGFGLALIWPHVWDPFQEGIKKQVEAGQLPVDYWLHGVEIYNLTLGFVCAFIVNVVVSVVWPGKRMTG